MDEISVRLLEKDEFESYSPLIFPSRQPVLSEDGRVLVSFCGKTPCGALGALPEDGRLYIASLYVLKSFRKRGAAAALLAEAEKLAFSMNLTALTAEYVYEDETAHWLGAMFESCGFLTPKVLATAYTLNFTAFEDTFMASLHRSPNFDTGICQSSKLPPELLQKYKQHTGHYLPDEYAPGDVAGEPVPELCLAYVDKDAVRSAIVTTVCDGHLRLAWGYVENRSMGLFMVDLIKTVVYKVRESFPQYTAITMLGDSELRCVSVERLLGDARYSRRSVYAAEKRLARS